MPEDARLAIYDRYLKRASTFFGIAKVCMRFIARASAIFTSVFHPSSG